MTLEIKELAEEVSDQHNLTKGQKIKLEKALKMIFEEGALPKDALGLSDQTLEALYTHAYYLYNAAKYKDAGYIFRVLQTLNPPDWRNYMGMGACLHRLGQYEIASFMYQTAGDLDKSNPMPYYYCSDCRIHMGHYRKAIHLLKQVIQRAIGKKEFGILRDRSLMTIHSLEEQIAHQEEQESSKT